MLYRRWSKKHKELESRKSRRVFTSQYYSTASTFGRGGGGTLGMGSSSCSASAAAAASMADLSRFRSPYSSFAGLSSTYNSLLQNGCYSSTSGYAASYSQGGTAFHLLDLLLSANFRTQIHLI